MKLAAMSIFAVIGSVAASPGCPGVPATNCAQWDCVDTTGIGESWCKCFDAGDEATYAATPGCGNSDGMDCVCPGAPPQPTCTSATQSSSYPCGNSHGQHTCPTAAVPNQWCNSDPTRMTLPWCATTHCEQCGYGFGIVGVGCENGIALPANSCQVCGRKDRGGCQPGVIPLHANGVSPACHQPNGTDPVVNALGMRLSLKANFGCGANQCMACGMLHTKPCNNGDGLPICDFGLSPRRFGNPSDNNCYPIKVGCPEPASDWIQAATHDWSTTSACDTLSQVGGIFYLPVVGTPTTPNQATPFVHGSTWVY